MMNKLILAFTLASAASAAPLGASPTATEIPGGCNPAHPGSCPSSYFTHTQSAPVETFTSIPGIPGGCNPAHPGSCPSSYFTYTKTPSQTFTSIPGIPGGCNPAHPGSCPSSYFTYTKTAPVETFVTPISPFPGIPGDCNPAHPGSCPTPRSSYPVVSGTAAPPASTGSSGSSPDDGVYPDPQPVDGKTWQILELTRYCGEDNDGCDYNFAIEAEGKTERCTIVRMPGSDAATESWTDEPCTDGSNFTVSWGYVTKPGPAFAVVTITKGKELAWFGVADVNGQKVTPSNPFGSGEYGDLGPDQVYTY
ncbi:hypothetical protein ACHAPJ_009518 [Fusarium lateritium]